MMTAAFYYVDGLTRISREVARRQPLGTPTAPSLLDRLFDRLFGARTGSEPALG
jgi:hypothetical protein